MIEPSTTKMTDMNRRAFLTTAGAAFGVSGAVGVDAAADVSKIDEKADKRHREIHETHEVDVCVIGGGVAGICAALSAARNGAKTLLMHERPVLGGNSSSECRVHICGADRSGHIPHMRETGILEELRLENAHRNPHHDYCVWDLILYEKARFQPNLALLLNCSCIDADMRGDRIESVSGWRMTTQTHHVVKARIFIDCSGDAVLAPLTGAEYRVGRESSSEYGESFAPETADRKTMGMTCLFQAREYDSAQPFEAPDWVYRYDREEDLPYGAKGHSWKRMGYWWIELGGEADSIRDTEEIRDELLKITLGVWDHIKNRGDHGAENWALEWLQFLPGKRESRRYLGEYTLKQQDIEAGGVFEDVVAYGGWTMDDHHPAGFNAVKLGAPATVFHPAPAPYGIPYRSLYAKRIENLMFAGRCHSATHVALSSTRVMGTAASMGQAAGTAAALAVSKNALPREATRWMQDLQQQLLHDDCYLPNVREEYSPLAMNSRLEASQGNPEPLMDGFRRQIGDDAHAWLCRPGDFATYLFPAPTDVAEATLVMDSAMERCIALTLHWNNVDGVKTPDVTPKSFRLEGLFGDAWTPIFNVANNRQRFVRIPIGKRLSGLRWVLEETWGAPETRLYAFVVA